LNKTALLVCQGTGCESSNAKKIRKSLVKAVEKYNLTSSITVNFTGCHGFCQKGPIIVIEPEGTFYTHVKEKNAEKIVYQHFIEKKPVEYLFYKDPTTSEYIQNYQDIPFYKYQQRIILRYCGHINPENIDEYLALDGYTALKTVLNDLKSDDVIEEIKKSKLRGRGGAGFSTGMKWKFCREAKGEPKYIICNADEGDPGAFMDRSTLEGDPHSVLEGIIIAAYAIGATKGYIYIRAEYPLAVKRFGKAIERARERGFLGKKILGSDFNFDCEIYEGAGAFVCGEETALMASIMGQRGNPKPRPPYPTTSGLWGRPTNINNVKTYAIVPVIINKGAEWYSSIGTEDSTGTAVFALTGKISNSGLIEVPFGTTLREIIFKIGGGIPNGKKFKGVQTGGPSGGCLPSDFLDSPVDFKTMADAGSIMGSGGMIILDNDDCMVKLANFFLTFIQAESCGKCVPCRLGTRAMLDILERIMEGHGEEKDLEMLEELAHLVQVASLCGLGQTAPNPVLTTIRYYREEYLSHIKYNRCPARECKALIVYAIDDEKCIGCTICSEICPMNAIIGKKGKIHSIDQKRCSQCGICESSCAKLAIIKLDRILLLNLTEEVIA
jgi:NADH-quinone oxidoreductase subunit F/NADP-reducing hydrogenase subunit HndC